jgi:hypothetical protein
MRNDERTDEKNRADNKERIVGVSMARFTHGGHVRHTTGMSAREDEHAQVQQGAPDPRHEGHRPTAGKSANDQEHCRDDEERFRDRRDGSANDARTGQAQPSKNSGDGAREHRRHRPASDRGATSAECSKEAGEESAHRQRLSGCFPPNARATATVKPDSGGGESSPRHVVHPAAAAGTMHLLAITEGDTENAPVVKDFLVGPRDRGFDMTRPILVLIDGAPSDRAAVGRSAMAHYVALGKFTTEGMEALRDGPTRRKRAKELANALPVGRAAASDCNCRPCDGRAAVRIV